MSRCPVFLALSKYGVGFLSVYCFSIIFYLVICYFLIRVKTKYLQMVVSVTVTRVYFLDGGGDGGEDP